MTIQRLANRGRSVENQAFTRRELVAEPYAELDDDALTRVRLILMNGIEPDAVRLSHPCERMRETSKHERVARLGLAERSEAEHLSRLRSWIRAAHGSVAHKRTAKVITVEQLLRPQSR